MTEQAEALVEAGGRKARADGRMREEFLEIAYAHSRLRGLFPWTGMGELHFSRCAEQLLTWGIPRIRPSPEESYWVSGPLRTEEAGSAVTADQAVEMVVKRLPHGCGSAYSKRIGGI